MEIKSYTSYNRNSKLDNEFYVCTLKRSDEIENIHQIITDLSKNNTVKKLALDFDWNSHFYSPGYRDSLPSSFYSLDQLTDLYLRYFNASPLGKVKGRLRCLKNLTVEYPTGNSLVHLLSVCPVLKNFTLIFPLSSYYRSDCRISIFNMCNNLSKIEHMSLCTFAFEVYNKEAPPVHPRKLVHLKYLCLHSMLTSNLHSILLLIKISPNLEKLIYIGLTQSILLLIKISPNLEKLKLQLVSEGTDSETQLDYPDIRMEHLRSEIRLEHLRELEIRDCGDKKCHSDFVRFILSKSPVLKKVSIAFHSQVFVDSVEGIETMRILVKSQCASPVAEISFKHPKYDLDGFKSLYLSGRPATRNQF